MRALLVTLWCSTIGVARANVPPSAILHLAAACEANEASGLDVALTLPLEGRPRFVLDDDVHGVPGMAELISGVEAADDRGRLPLVRRLATNAHGHRALELQAARAATGAVTLRYRARSIAAADSGPREGLRHDATGIGGIGEFFLVLPESTRTYRIRVEWAETACARGAQGLSSFGDAEITGDLGRLGMAAYFLGHPRTYSIDEGSEHLRTAWFGTPSFDTAAASAWAARVQAAERRFFGDDDARPYYLFIRVLAAMGDRSNGTGQITSFLSAIGPRTPFGPRLRTNIAHEMFHRWLGRRLRLAGPDGVNFWFTEGFTVYYANVLTLRAGLITRDEFLDELNGAVTRYFANTRAQATNDEIRRGFLDDEELTVLPYARGALYAAELDAAIRQASRGTRSLDDLMRDLYRAALSAPRDLPAGRFRDAVLRELGRPGADRFDAVIGRGATPDPPSDAFGPCFSRVPRAYALYQLGFDERQSLRDNAIRRLVAGSAAAKAGLTEGEELVSLETSRVFPGKPTTVVVKRNGKDVAIRYLPANPSPQRDGYAWVRAKCPWLP